MSDLALVMASRIWSPIVWQGGLRSTGAFEKAGLVALDFDDGAFTLDDALSLVREWGLSHVIGTTKSHQVAKVSQSGKYLPACDRFRLVFVADRWMRDQELYTYNMKSLIDTYKADRSCKDAARFFWPCKEIVSYAMGRQFVWQDFPDDYVPESEAHRRLRETLRTYGASGVIPPWLKEILEKGVEPGGRHVACYKLGAQLTAFGLGEAEIVALALRSPLAEIGEGDLRRAVRNGIKAELESTR